MSSLTDSTHFNAINFFTNEEELKQFTNLVDSCLRSYGEISLHTRLSMSGSFIEEYLLSKNWDSLLVIFDKYCQILGFDKNDEAEFLFFNDKFYGDFDIGAMLSGTDYSRLFKIFGKNGIMRPSEENLQQIYENHCKMLESKAEVADAEADAEVADAEVADAVEN